MNKHKCSLLVRNRLDDVDYVRQLGLPPECSALGIAVRNAMGRMCEIDPRLLYREDDMLTLCDLMWSGWEPVQFASYLQIELGQDIDLDRIQFPDVEIVPTHFWQRPVPTQLGEWTLQVVQMLSQLGRGGTTSSGETIHDPHG
jgi:hypothetical protein